MLPRCLTRLVAFGIVTISSCIVTTNAMSEYNGSPRDILNQSLEDFAKHMHQGYESFKDSVKTDYEFFRDSINAEYASFMRHKWTPSQVEKKLDLPLDKDTGPDIEPEDGAAKTADVSKKIKIEEVLPVIWPPPQPVPVSPIKEMPAETGSDIEMLFYGTPVKIRTIDLSSFSLNGNDENSFADGWEILSRNTTNNLISDCLKIRDNLRLPDWGYIKLLDMVASTLTEKNSNEQRLLQGFLLNQSGYKVRFSYDSRRQLHLLFASLGIIYDLTRFYLDDEWYYSYTHPSDSKVYICDFSTPGEKAIDMGIHKSPAFDYSPCRKRDIRVIRYPGINLTLTPNKNLIDFFDDYPYATLDTSPYSVWAIHGNTPVSDEIKEQLYPSLRQVTDGKSQYEALQFLLKVAQSFPYGYDEEIWGRERAFWMEESWAYPESDCEDHAVNFSHMVRDILGLDVCLVYYPGHLSSCVAVTDDNITGDFVTYDGKNYIVCDPTYFYCDVGRTSPSNNNAKAILIPLRKLE